MLDNGRCRPYILKARRTLATSWLCPLLVHEQDKVVRQKGLVLHSKVAIKGFGRRNKRLQHNIFDLFSGIPTVPDR